MMNQSIQIRPGYNKFTHTVPRSKRMTWTMADGGLGVSSQSPWTSVFRSTRTSLISVSRSLISFA
jgi:hypothetical protein